MSPESINLSVVFYNIANEGQFNILAQGLQVVQVFYTNLSYITMKRAPSAKGVCQVPEPQLSCLCVVGATSNDHYTRIAWPNIGFLGKSECSKGFTCNLIL